MMNNLMGIFATVFCIVLFVIRLIKYIYIFKKHNIEVPAVILNTDDQCLDNNEDETHNLKVGYIYKNEKLESTFKTFLYKSPLIGTEIIIRIDSSNPNKVKYYGSHNKHYFIHIIGMIVVIIVSILYLLYYTGL